MTKMPEKIMRTDSIRYLSKKYNTHNSVYK